MYYMLYTYRFRVNEPRPDYDDRSAPALVMSPFTSSYSSYRFRVNEPRPDYDDRSAPALVMSPFTSSYSSPS